MEQNGLATQKKLLRDVKREALARMEDAARTQTGFENIVKQWNRLDRNRERRERRREIGRGSEEMLHWDRTSETDEKGKMKGWIETAVRRPIAHEWWRQLISGDFLDTIYDCPHELHELVTDTDSSLVLRDLSENHREILYYSAIRQHSAVRIAARRKQTPRNIRKVRELLLRTTQDKLCALLDERLAAGRVVTPAMRRFHERHKPNMKVGKAKSILKRIMGLFDKDRRG